MTRAGRKVKRSDIPTAQQLADGFFMQYLAIRDMLGDDTCADLINFIVDDFTKEQDKKETEEPKYDA